jgi:gas vesicle protein
MANKQQSGLLGGLVVGAAIGAIVGVSLAPRKGKETRKILKKTASALPQLAEDISSQIGFQTMRVASPWANRLTEMTIDSWHDTIDRLQEAIAAGVAASREVRQQPTEQEKS